MTREPSTRQDPAPLPCSVTSLRRHRYRFLLAQPSEGASPTAVGAATPLSAGSAPTAPQISSPVLLRLCSGCCSPCAAVLRAAGQPDLESPAGPATGGRYRPSGRPLRAPSLAVGGYRAARAAEVPSTRCRPGGILALHRCAHTHPSPMEVLRRARGIPRHQSSHRAPAACAHRPASSKAGDQCAAGVDATWRASPTRHQRLLLPPAGARRL